MKENRQSTSLLNRCATFVRRAAPIIVTACGASMLTLVLHTSHSPSVDQNNPANFSAAAPGDNNILDRRGDGMRDMRPGPISEEEWKEAEKFFTEVTPVRAREFRYLQDGEPRMNLRRALVARYRALQKTKAESPELYDTQIRELKVNDDVLRICLEMKKAGHDKPRLQNELSARVTELYDLGLNDRKLRIAMLDSSLGKQKDSLAHDERFKTALAKQQYEFILAHGVEGANFDGPKRGPQKTKSGSTTAPSSPGEISPGDQ